MGYRALYREFRPLKFSDMVGQDHISQILKNQIINDRIGHAYLFSGIRGTGKTTTAKIFARAVNCINSLDGEPCNECEICKGILSETISDVTEIDAASNNGVDNIRQIRDEVMYLPTKAKYRVYIIDEVHMLSTGAFNALLKTLEEPPEHVKFILATTEPNKLPATILSRCQRFDFKRIQNDDVVKRLEEILNSIGKSAEPSALKMIAEISEGAMRDAISILDRCVSDTDNITVDYIAGLIGMPDSMQILNIIENIVNKNPQQMIVSLDNMLSEGKNISLLLTECIKHMQNILMYQVAQKIDIYSEEQKNKVEQISKIVDSNMLVQLITQLSQIINSIKWSSNQEIVAKAQLISLCMEKAQSIEVEKKTSKIVVPKEDVIAKTKVEVVKEQKDIATKSEDDIKKQQLEEKKQSNNIEEYFDYRSVEHWSEILADLKNNGKVRIYANLINATAQMIADNVIGLYFKVEFAKNTVEAPESIEAIKQSVRNVIDKEYQIKCFLQKEDTKNKMSNMEDMAKKFNIPMDIVDE